MSLSMKIANLVRTFWLPSALVTIPNVRADVSRSSQHIASSQSSPGTTQPILLYLCIVFMVLRTLFPALAGALLVTVSSPRNQPRSNSPIVPVFLKGSARISI
ncbi:hypothetical protein K443DRAFT_685399 [Laccaria amethystina LaAM-08-1]|uniref:Uncharacterized protein n=1 Tax=Laccaria amethystina LaAM-08-1 TaxID=1095629 RepID=A0A0C9WI30_9AGAR|nr:hypothetical protein K443DRAFT_685399 [Laccaria amethystina LaAM-08-1]